VRERFPDEIDGYWGAAGVLHAQGRPDESDGPIDEAHPRFPGNALIAMNFARIPERKGEWSIAIQRWRGVGAIS